MARPLLLVLAGLPGTGKTTLSRRLSRERGACYLRVDVVETALVREGATVGATGYVVVHELAVSNLLLGNDVVVDAVNPVPEARVGWSECAARGGAELVVVETVLPDLVEHQRRVEERLPDLPDQVVPTWQQVQARDYVPWQEERDGPRLVVDTTDSEAAWTQLVDATRRSTR